MSLEHVHGPAFLLRYRDAQRAVLAEAEAIVYARRNGTLSTAALQRLESHQDELDRLRGLYLRGLPTDAA